MALIKVGPQHSQGNQRQFIDGLSKFYIIAGNLFGPSKLPILLKDSKYFYIITLLAYGYSFALTICTVISAYNPADILTSLICAEYVFYVVLAFVSWKNGQLFYNELNNFDNEAGCRPRTKSQSLHHFYLELFLFGLTYLYYGWLNLSMMKGKNTTIVVISLFTQFMAHGLEPYYCGHLLSLLTPRLRLINYYLESRLACRRSRKSMKQPDVEEFVYFKNKDKENKEMRKLMDLYHIAIKAHYYLVEATKWQIFVCLTTTFIRTLLCSYIIAVSYMHDTVYVHQTIMLVGTTTSEMVPLLFPCVRADQVRAEVVKLRELLASRLYDNNLDKAGRGCARALLALAEARDLSFALLHMLRVDVTLPLKFIATLITYLIVLVQFDRVLNPLFEP